MGGNGRRTEITGTGGWRILKLSNGKFPSKVGGKDRGKVLLGLPLGEERMIILIPCAHW